MQDPDNLSALYRCAIKEDQRQKIRELDFGKSSSQASAQFDINAIKGSGCYKCGSNDHFIKDCPLNREKDSGSYTWSTETTMIIDQNHMMRILWRNQFRP